MKNRNRLINSIEYVIIGIIFLILFVIPVLFIRIRGEISWIHVIKIWQDQILLIPLFGLNHWLFVPKFLIRKKYIPYLICVVSLISVFSFSYYYHEEVLRKKVEREGDKPKPIPPYAHLLMYSILIVGVDSGLLVSRKWHENEQKRHLLEKQNTQMQLEILRNQISPHFFMNTLNNIYALIDCNTLIAKESVMKLSKLMRYMLYENQNGKVKLSREFEFINSYIDLMKLRFTDEMRIHLIVPQHYTDSLIPPMLFISYIENAFKYGASYQQESLISIVFEVSETHLTFVCTNTINLYSDAIKGGLGLKNNENRLKLLFENNYTLSIHSTEKLFTVSLQIPLS